MDENHSEDNRRGQLPVAPGLLYNEFQQLTVRQIFQRIYTLNKLACSFVNGMQQLWPDGTANWSIINILQVPWQHSRLWHLLNYLWALPKPHKYYIVFTRALYNIAKERILPARSQSVAEHSTIERFYWWLHASHLYQDMDKGAMNCVRTYGACKSAWSCT